MKKLILSIVFICLYAIFGAKRVKGWFGATHEDITKKSLELLASEHRHKEAEFYKPWHEQILLGSRQPDFSGDPDNGRGTHYYSCSDSRGNALKLVNGYYKNRLGKYMRSARTFFEENYTCALNLYKSGDVENAMRYLGRAIHFVEDMSCTVHTANMVYTESPKNVHYQFEKHTNSVYKDIKANSVDKRFSKAYQKDIGGALNRLVEYSASYADDIRGLDQSGFNKAAGELLPYAQQNVYALLIRFYRDCHEDRRNYLRDGGRYSIENVGKGLVLSAGNKRAILKAMAKNDATQRFNVRIMQDGTFALLADNGCYIDSKGCYVQADTGKPPRFRAAALGEGRFRIVPQECDYRRVLAGGLFGRIRLCRFVPGDGSQAWLISEC